MIVFVGALVALTVGLWSPPPPAPGPVVADGHADLLPAQLPSIDFEQALDASQQRPALRGLLEATRAKRSADGDLPVITNGPQITVMPGVRVMPEPNRGVELQVNATQAWNLEGYGKKRHVTAGAENEVLDAEARALALTQRMTAARIWVELHAAEAQRELAVQEVALARARRSKIEEAVAQGVGRASDAAQAKADEAEAWAVLTELRGVTHDLGLVLAHETGNPVDTPLATHGPFPDPPLPEVPELRRRFAAVDNLPEVAVRRLRARAIRAQAAESAASRGTQLITGINVQREATSDVALFGVVGIALSGDRGQRQRASSLADARRLEGEADEQRASLGAMLATLVHELHHAEEREQVLRDRVVPSLEAVATSHATAVELGEGTVSELLLAQRYWAAAQRRLVDAHARVSWARVEAWLYLQGVSQDGAAAPSGRAQSGGSR